MSDVGSELRGSVIGRTVLRVRDCEQVARFYRDAVGLTRLERTGNRITLGAGGEVLLELIGDPSAPPRESDQTGLFHTAFRVPTRAALGDALRRIRNGWRLDGAADHLVSEALYLSDPEGNGVEIYWDRPRATWPTTADGDIEMGTQSLDIAAIIDHSQGASQVPAETTVGHVHLEVSSLSRAKEFYVDGLGLRVRQADWEGSLFLATDDYHHHVGLNTWNGRTEPPEGCGLEWVEVLVPDRTVLEDLEANLESRSIGSGRENEDGTGRLVVTDPDGLEFRIAGDD